MNITPTRQIDILKKWTDYLLTLPYVKSHFVEGSLVQDTGKLPNPASDIDMRIVVDDSALDQLPIPLVFLREMIADWRGAGRVQNTPNTRKWYETNKDKLYLHPDTRTMVELIL